MLDPKSFRFIENFTRADLDAHPVWRHYDESRDRELILGWGVGAECLQREEDKFRFCGPHPLYPVLHLAPLPDGPDMNIRARFVTSNGCHLDGYVIEPHAFGLFVSDTELCFNRNLPSAASRQAGELAIALGSSIDAIFPLSYETALERADGSAVEGKIERYW